MVGLIVILLCACKLASLTSSTCVKTIEFSLKNEARKAYLHVHKRIIIMPAIMKEVMGVARIFQRGGGVTHCHCLSLSHCHRHGVFATEYCRLFA